MRQIQGSFIREILQAASDDSVISFAGGLPCEDCFPAAAISEALARALERPGKALQYAETPGYEPLREWIADRLRREHGLDYAVEQIMVTTGSQQGLDLAGKLFADHLIAVENPSYLGALQAFAANGLSPTAIDITTQALAPNSLLYSMSRFANPTGHTRDLQEVEAIARRLADSGAWLLEDDPYGEIHFDDVPSPLVARAAPDRVVYLGSFSKSVAPSLRLGFAAGPKPVIDAMIRLKQAADLHTSGLLQIALHELFTGSFSFDAHLTSIRAEYRRRHDAMYAAIRELLPSWALAEARGGMFLWARAPGVDTSELFRTAIGKRVAFVPGVHFFAGAGGTADASGASSEFVRLNFSNCDEFRIREGVMRIAAAMRNM